MTSALSMTLVWAVAQAQQEQPEYYNPFHFRMALGTALLCTIILTYVLTTGKVKPQGGSTFRRSDDPLGYWVVTGFVGVCAALLWAMFIHEAWLPPPPSSAAHIDTKGWFDPTLIPLGLLFVIVILNIILRRFTDKRHP